MKICEYVFLQELLSSICSNKCDIPQPLDITGTITTNLSEPLDISGNIVSDVSGTITANIPQPLTITGTINTVSIDACAEAMSKILSQTSSYNEIILQNGEQFQNVENLTVDGYIVSFSSQNQKIQTTLCNIEYVALE